MTKLTQSQVEILITCAVEAISAFDVEYDAAASEQRKRQLQFMRDDLVIAIAWLRVQPVRAGTPH